jgi:hypothetical protein
MPVDFPALWSRASTLGKCTGAANDDNRLINKIVNIERLRTALLMMLAFVPLKADLPKRRIRIERFQARFPLTK